jgi:hypothetical protein
MTFNDDGDAIVIGRLAPARQESRSFEVASRCARSLRRLGGRALRERTINRKPRPSMLIPPRDIESSGGFSGMASSGGFSGMDLGFSVWVSPTENWYFPPLGFCF